MYESRNDDAGLGLLPIAGALPAAGSVISAIGGIFGGSDNTGRFRTNLELYNAAIAGDTVALAKLKAKADGGWATKEAINDAKQKYASAVAILGIRAPVAPVASMTTPSLSIPPLVLAGVAALGVVILMRRKR